MSKETDISGLKVGQNIVFTGFSDPENLPDQHELLVADEVYAILSIEPESVEEGQKMEAMVEVGVPNPDFDHSRRASKSNTESITYTIFANEISTDGVPETTGEDETGDAAEVEAVEPAPAKKTSSTKKTTSAKKSAPKTSAKATTAASAKKTTSTKKAAPKKKGTTTKVGSETPAAAPKEAGKTTTATAPKKKVTTKKAATSSATEPAAAGTKAPATKKKSTTVKKKGTAAKKTTAKTGPTFNQEELDNTNGEPTAAKKTTSTKKKVSTKKATAKAKTQTAPKKKSTKKKDEDAQYDEDKVLILTEEEEDADILALVREAGDIIELAQDEIEDASRTEFRLGGVLYHVKRSRTWKEHEENKYNRRGGWGDFISDVLGMEYRKAMYLIDIYTKFSKYGIPASEAARMGWTKASVIAAVMTADNADDLVEAAGNQTVSTLKETTKTMRATGGRQVVAMTVFKFRLSEDAGASVRETIELAKDALGDNRDDSQVFEHIVMEWAQEHLAVADVQKASRKPGKK